MTLHDGRVIKINKTIRNLGNECKDLLPMQALTRCDAVFYGKGKITAANLLLKMNLNLEQICDDQTAIEVIDSVGIDFLACLYDGKPENSHNNLRYCLRKDPPKI